MPVLISLGKFYDQMMGFPQLAEKFKQDMGKIETLLNDCLSIKDERQMLGKLSGYLSKMSVYGIKDVGDDANLHFYICNTRNEVLLLMVDHFSGDEIADEEPLEVEDEYPVSFPLYFSVDSHRVSPVYKMYALHSAVNEYLKGSKSIMCLILTKSNILNYDDMIITWSFMQVAVRCMKTFDNLDIKIGEPNASWRKFFDRYTLENILLGVNCAKLLKILFLAAHTDEETLSACAPEKKSPQPAKQHAAKNVDEFREVDIETIIDKDNPVYHTLTPDGTSSYSRAGLPNVKVFAPLSDPSKMLEKLVGLDNVKGHLKRLANLIEFNRMICKENLKAKCPKVSLHSLFLGNPGTGKTTLAMLYASLLHKAGVLSGGNVIVANRGSFLGRWVGTEERNVAMVLEMSKGNLLMLDEAHTFAGASPNDYARNVLPMMMTALADESRRDFAVVLCGYEAEMENLLKTDPGLAGRFSNRFHFEDYQPQQLLEIARERITGSGYILSDSSLQKLDTLLEMMYKNRKKGWANAREVASVCDNILVTHADRCIREKRSGMDLIKITEEDIPAFVADREGAPLRKIGFANN